MGTNLEPEHHDGARAGHVDLDACQAPAGAGLKHVAGFILRLLSIATLLGRACAYHVTQDRRKLLKEAASTPPPKAKKTEGRSCKKSKADIWNKRDIKDVPDIGIGNKRNIKDIPDIKPRKHKKGTTNQNKKPPTVIMEAMSDFFSCFHKQLTDEQRLLPMKDFRMFLSPKLHEQTFKGFRAMRLRSGRGDAPERSRCPVESQVSRR